MTVHRLPSVFAPSPHRKPPKARIPASEGESTPLSLPWWIGKSDFDTAVYWRKRARHEIGFTWLAWWIRVCSPWLGVCATMTRVFRIGLVIDPLCRNCVVQNEDPAQRCQHTNTNVPNQLPLLNAPQWLQAQPLVAERPLQWIDSN